MTRKRVAERGLNPYDNAGQCMSWIAVVTNLVHEPHTDVDRYSVGPVTCVGPCSRVGACARLTARGASCEKHAVPQ